MVRQSTSIRNRVLIITVVAILTGLLVPKVWVQEKTIYFAALLIIGGIPHGAADYLIFRLLIARNPEGRGRFRFILVYLSVIALYCFVWWWQPLLALAIFVLISIYHFGQSNWVRISFPHVYWSVLTYLLWGGLIVGLPVLIYQEQSELIISEISGIRLQLGNYRWPILFSLALLNVLNIIYLFEARVLSAGDGRKELINLAVLMALFLTTPLLIGFGIYFLFWHALGAINDQLSTLRQLKNGYSLRAFLMHIGLFSLLAAIGLLAAYQLMEVQLNREAGIGLLFLFISVITVPHSIIMDRFYLIIGTDSKKH